MGRGESGAGREWERKRRELTMNVRVMFAKHSATHCNILQHTATDCNTLQNTATHQIPTE